MVDLPGALEPFARRPAEAALFLDFDGTLAEIVADPADALALPGVPAVLERLGRRFGQVAVVSGRPVSFLAVALGSPDGVHLAGLYGLEEVDGRGVPTLAPGADAWRDAIAGATARAEASVPAGAFVEEKGLTVTLHWRGAPQAEGWAWGFAETEREASGLVGVEGRFALELRPPLRVDKGTVVRRLGAGHPLVACFGDDLGDLPAFGALDELRAGGALTVKVAVSDAESPPEVAAEADLVVEGPSSALALLRSLAGG